MSWNRRVIKYSDGEMGIHEVYNNEDGSIKFWNETASEYSDAGNDQECLKSLAEDCFISYMQHKVALEKPILVFKDGKLIEQSVDNEEKVE